MPDQRSGTALKYRTPADIRAIPNETWETWLRDGSLPILDFFTPEEIVMLPGLNGPHDLWGHHSAFAAVLRATQRRMKANG